MTKTVTIAATRAGGEPYAHHDVIVTLVAGSAGGVVGSNVIVEQSTVKLDADGEGSIVLRTNDVEITSPSTSFYRLTVADSSPTITRSIRVTDDLPSSVSWTLAGIQVGDPTIPQRDVSSDYVTIGGQSLTNYLADRGGGVSLGETSTTAYRGDRGKAAYDHSQVVTGNPHGTTATDVGAQPVDSDLTAIAALTTTSFGRALLELADAAAARTAIGAMASTATLPWHDDFTVVHVVRDPLPVTGTYTQTPGALRGGGYTLSQTGTGWVFTYARIPLRAGTYTRRYVARTDSNSGIVTFTIGGISAGTADGYSVGNVNDVVFDATGIVIPSDGFYDLVLTSTTRNASSAGWRANAQLTRLFRTGA